MKRIISFLAILTIFLLAAHYAVYLMVASAIPFLAITRVWVRLLYCLLFAVSFPLASVWVSKSAELPARRFYKVTAYWMGLFAYLFLGAVVWSILVYFFPFEASSAGIARFFCLISVALVVYGTFHAKIIFEKRYSIILARLPEAWKSKCIVFMSDLHLGAVHGQEYASRIVREVQKHAPDIIFITGDFFDGVKLDEMAAASPFATLKPKDGMYFATGNHEEFTDSASKLAALRAAGMHILNNEKVEIDGVQIIGVDYMTTRSDVDFTQTLERLEIDADKPSILLKHVPTHMKTSTKAGISLVLSGHTHNGQQAPFSYVAKWTHKGFNYGAYKYRALQAIVTSGIGTWGPPVRVGTQNEIVVINFN